MESLHKAFALPLNNSIFFFFFLESVCQQEEEGVSWNFNFLIWKMPGVQHLANLESLWFHSGGQETFPAGITVGLDVGGEGRRVERGSKFYFKWLLSFCFLVLEHLTCFYSWLYSVSFSYLFGNDIQFSQAWFSVFHCHKRGRFTN